MTQEILISATPFGIRAAIIGPEGPVALSVESALRPSHVGDLVLGRVARIMPALRGAFVALPDEREGWLESAARLTPGDTVIVQVLSDARGRKGPRLGATPALAGRRLVLRPGAASHGLSRRIGDEAERARLMALLASLGVDGGALTARARASGVTEAELRAEAERLRDDWRRIEAAADGAAPKLLHSAGGLLGRLVREQGDGARLVCDDPTLAVRLGQLAAGSGAVPAIKIEHVDDADLFERHDCAGAFEAALDPLIAFKGGRLIVEETEALVAIDVDLSGRAPAEASLDALEAAARVIRLRNLAGLIVLDLPRLRAKGLAARQVARLSEALADDPARIELHGTSAAGLLELTRQRIGESIADALSERSAPGGARTPRLEALAFDLAYAARRAVRRGRRRLTIRAAPALAALLGPGPLMPSGLDAWLGAALTLKPEPTRAPAAFEIEG